MICAIHLCQVAKHLESIDLSQHILPYDEPDLYNDYIAKEPDYKDRFYINFPRHQETNECRPTQIEIKENNKQKENTAEEQEIQECDYLNI